MLDMWRTRAIQYGDTPRPAGRCRRDSVRTLTADKVGAMIRKDIAADLDRPRYYSQFWIDVAMGKRDVTMAGATETPAPVAEADEAAFEVQAEPEFEPEPLPIRAAPAPSMPKKKPEK